MKYMFVLILTFVSLTAYSQSSGDDLLTTPAKPIEIGGPNAGTIIGNNGDLFGGEFSKIIRIDVYQKLEWLFASGQVPKTHPIYILKDKMTKFKSLLDDKYRVYAVDPKSTDVKDVFGDVVLARVVPQRYIIRHQTNTETTQRVVAESSVSVDEFQKKGIISFESDILNRILFHSDGSAQVRVGGDFIDSNDQPLPPGFVFYSKCSDPQELIRAVKLGTASSIHVLCNGYRFDGAVATIDGTLDLEPNSANMKVKADLEVQLEFQSYIIEVNRPRFSKVLLERGQKAMQILVFHEYLRLLGIDDDGYKISVYARNLDDAAAGKKLTLAVGDQVIVPKGIATIATTDQAPALSENPESTLNPITYRGVIEKVMSKKYHIQQLPFVQDGQKFYVVDAMIEKQVVKVRAMDASNYVKPVQFYWLDDVTLYQVVIKD